MNFWEVFYKTLYDYENDRTFNLDDSMHNSINIANPVVKQRISGNKISNAGKRKIG